VDLVGGLAGTVVSQFTLLAADVSFSVDDGLATLLVLSVSLGANERTFLGFLGDALLVVFVSLVSLGARSLGGLVLIGLGVDLVFTLAETVVSESGSLRARNLGFDVECECSPSCLECIP